MRHPVVDIKEALVAAALERNYCLIAFFVLSFFSRHQSFLIQVYIGENGRAAACALESVWHGLLWGIVRF